MLEQKQKVFGVVEFHGAVMVGYKKWICSNEATTLQSGQFLVL